MAPKSKSKLKSTVSCRFFKQDKAAINTPGVSQASFTDDYLRVLPTGDDKGDAETIQSDYGASSSAANEYRAGDRSSGNGQTYKYCPQTFSNAETRNFSSNSTWDMNKLEGGIKRVSFGPDFNVNDTHLAAICCRPDLASSLISLSLGDSDSGNGAGLTDHGVIVLVRACPNLRELRLSAATKLTDEAFLAICQACPSMESLCITGNDKVKGKLTGASLKKLIDSSDLVPKLKRLVLWDQNYMREKVQALSCARPELAIETGETLGDGIAANMIAATTGGAQTRTWLGGKVVDVHTDPGWYAPGMMDFPDLGGGLMALWDFGTTGDEGDSEEDQEIEEGEDDYSE